MSVQAEIQKLIRDLLLANAGVSTLVDGVYDSVAADPFGANAAYISFGPVDVVEDDADGIVGGIHTVQLDCWSRSVGSVGCKRIVDAVKAALHDKPADLPSFGLVQMRVRMRRTLADPDGLTTHGVVSVEIDAEEALY